MTAPTYEKLTPRPPEPASPSAPTAAGKSPTTPSSSSSAATASAATSVRRPESPPAPSASSTPPSRKPTEVSAASHWFDAHAGDAARELYFPQVKDEQVASLSEEEQRKLYLPDDTLKAFEYYSLGLKGPLTTPIGGGFRSINVYLRLRFDLYACVRPVRYFKGVEAPNKRADKVNMVIFRENTEDVYCGIEAKSGSQKAKRFIALLKEMGYNVPTSAGIGIKPMSPEGSKRLIRMAIRFAVDKKLPSVTLMHKGNIMKFTEGAFKDWGYEAGARRVPRPGRQRGRSDEGGGREGQGRPQGPDRRQHVPADPVAARRVQRGGHAEPQRRLPVRRGGGDGGRHRPGGGGQHRRPGGDVRGDARHRPQVHRPEPGQPRRRAAVGRAPSGTSRMGRGGENGEPAPSRRRSPRATRRPSAAPAANCTSPTTSPASSPATARRPAQPVPTSPSA